MKALNLFLLFVCLFTLGFAADVFAAKPVHVRLDGAEKVYVGASLSISDTDQTYIVSPVNGDITNIWGVNKDVAVVSATVVTFKINAVTAGTISIVSGTAVGAAVSATVSTSNTIDLGQTIELESDGGATSASTFEWLVEITPDYTD